MRRPYAYLRKSRVMPGRETVSPEMQIAAVNELAARYGDPEPALLSDMNISGRKGRSKRPGFDQLLTAIEAGEVSAVYSYSLSRLSRSIRDIADLAEFCQKHDVPIRLARDVNPDYTTATGRAVLNILAAMAQMDAELAQERARDTAAARRARGDRMGGPAFEDVAVVVDAFRRAGSATGAAKILTVSGVPTRNGNRLWYPSAVTVILERAAPGLLPVIRHRGVKVAAPFTFFRLLRCWCGTTMTGFRRGPTSKAPGYVSYRCTRGRLLPGHGKTHVAETQIMGWAVAEMSRLQIPEDHVQIAAATDAQVAALRERLERAKRLFLDGDMDRAAYESEKHTTTEALTRLDLAGRAVRIPRFEWNHEPRELNLALRALWDHVELGPDLRPVRAEWLVPSSWLRAAGPGQRSPAAPKSRTS